MTRLGIKACVSFLTRALADHCSSELIFTWTVTNALRTPAETRNDKPRGANEEVAATLRAWWLIYPCSFVSALFLLFCVCARLLFFASSSLSLYWFMQFVLPCSADFNCRKWSKDRKAVPACLNLFCCSFLISLSFLSSVLSFAFFVFFLCLVPLASLLFLFSFFFVLFFLLSFFVPLHLGQ